jgi:hypothetical protein
LAQEIGAGRGQALEQLDIAGRRGREKRGGCRVWGHSCSSGYSIILASAT